MSEAEDELSALDKNPSNRRGPVGCVEKAIEHHEDLRSLILGAVHHPKAEASVSARFLQGKGIDISQYTIARHRRGDCRCLVR